MVYLWRCADDYPRKLYGRYNRQRGPDRFLYLEGRNRPQDMAVPEIVFDASPEQLKKWDSLCNDAGLPLVGERIIKILNDMAPDDVELMDVVVTTKKGPLTGYKIVNVLNAVKGLDHENSDFTYVEGTTVICHIRRLQYLPDCLGDLQIARDVESLPHILVSFMLKDRFQADGIRGVELYPPEEYLG